MMTPSNNICYRVSFSDSLAIHFIYPVLIVCKTPTSTGGSLTDARSAISSTNISVRG
jgi:hypothetical protein